MWIILSLKTKVRLAFCSFRGDFLFLLCCVHIYKWLLQIIMIWNVEHHVWVFMSPSLVDLLPTFGLSDFLLLDQQRLLSDFCCVNRFPDILKSIWLRKVACIWMYEINRRHQKPVFLGLLRRPLFDKKCVCSKQHKHHFTWSLTYLIFY